MQQSNHTAWGLHLANPIPAHQVAAVEQMARENKLLGHQIKRWLRENTIKKAPVST